MIGQLMTPQKFMNDFVIDNIIPTAAAHQVGESCP